MKIVKMPLLLLAIAAITTLVGSRPAQAQEVTREQAQAVLARVSQDVWHAQHSSTGYGRVQALYNEGERAYFEGKYAESVKKLKMADKIVRDMPNDFSGPAETELNTSNAPAQAGAPTVHTAP